VSSITTNNAEILKIDIQNGEYNQRTKLVMLATKYRNDSNEKIYFTR